MKILLLLIVAAMTLLVGCGVRAGRFKECKTCKVPVTGRRPPTSSDSP